MTKPCKRVRYVLHLLALQCAFCDYLGDLGIRSVLVVDQLDFGSLEKVRDNIAHKRV